MRGVRRAGLMLLMIVTAAALTWTAASNASGAPANAAQQGCTCHNAQPSAGVQVAVAGFPTAYELGKSYPVTLSIAGGPAPVPVVSQNQGGFAVRVTGGTLVAGAGSQIRENGAFATHTAAGNDQRSWSFAWVASTNGSATVTVFYAGNAVDGDATNQGNLDMWNRGMLEVPAASSGATNGTSPAPASSGTPVPVVVPLAAFAVAAMIWRRP